MRHNGRQVKQEIIPHEDRNGYRIVYHEPEEDGNGEIIHLLPGPDQLPARPQRTQAVLEGSYSDRARGFTIKTFWLSCVVGGAAWILSQWALEYPLLSILSLVWIVSGFLTVWLGAFVIDLLASAEGVELIEVLSFWRYVNREQQERWRNYREEPPRRAGVTLGDLIIAAAVVGLGALILGLELWKVIL